METRYRSYLEKARSVIKTLDPKHNNNTEVVALRAQITEKDRRIRRLEAEQREKGKSRDQEEKLLVSAWYQLGVENDSYKAIPLNGQFLRYFFFEKSPIDLFSANFDWVFIKFDKEGGKMRDRRL